MKTLKIGLAIIIFAAIVALLPHQPKVHAQQFSGANAINCVVTVSTATTIQAVGGNCVAPGSIYRLYITDVQFSASASGITADSFPTLKTGTGGTCGSNTSVVWTAFTAAAAQASVVQDFTTPIKLPLNQELCWIESTAGSKTVTINGYIAP